MKILLESHQLHSDKKTGVGYYEQVLFDQLLQAQKATITPGVFKETALRTTSQDRSKLSRRVAVKLGLYGLHIPARRIWKKPYDAYIFPDFFYFPTHKPSAVVIHDLTYLHNPEYLPQSRNKYLDYVFPSLGKALARAVPYAVKKADTVVATSYTVKQELMNAYAVPEKKIVVQGIPPEKTYSPSSSQKHLPKLPTKKFLYFQATLEPRKNHAKLIKAYLLLPKELRDEYSLVLGGRIGWNCEEALRLIKEPGVVHLDYVSDAEKLSLYRHATAYLQPSHSEGFGMPLLEAMACGSPVICSDIPIFREVCEDAAVFFNKDSPEDIAHVIEDTLKNSDLQKDLVRRGKERVAHYRKDTGGLEQLLSRLSVE